MRRRLWIPVAICSAALMAAGAEADALALSANIQARHMPFGTLLDPFYASASSDVITGYTRCGDSALWTGHYLAAESYRYRVTGAPDALANARRALEGLKGLVDVTGTNLLARCRVAIASPFAEGILREEAANGVYTNAAAGFRWIGNTSRDQYCGVVYGLGVAYDLIPDAAMQTSIHNVLTRLVTFLLDNNWSAPMPDGRSGTSFVLRPDEQLAILQVARRVNSERFGAAYESHRTRLAGSVAAPVAFDSLSTSSYFKFNLIYITFFHLIRLEEPETRGIYERAYAIARNYTSGHQNAFFNMIDMALFGADARRDAETLTLLDLWLQRPRRDLFVDLRGRVPVCGDQACDPIPVNQRTPTDFLWQRSPFQLFGGGTGTIGNAGVDYVLPYWMARYYGLLADFRVQPAAASGPAVAPDSIVSLYGTDLTGQTALNSIGLRLVDSGGVETAGQVIYASPLQVNAVLPPGIAPGPASFRVTGDGRVLRSAMGLVQPVAPALFTMNGRLAAATAVRVSNGVQSDVPVFQCEAAGCRAVPIELSAETPVYMTLYGTGFRRQNAVQATAGGRPVQILYAGAQPGFPGLDQVNIDLPIGLLGSGDVEIVFAADGFPANSVWINVR